MAIWNLYSKRKKAAERSANDVYEYEIVPEPLRVQLVHLFDDAINNERRGVSRYDNFRIDDDTVEVIVRALRLEYGRLKLTSYSSKPIEELLLFLQQCDTDQFLDCIEIYGRLIEGSDHLEKHAANDLILEINHRIRESSLGYEFVNGYIVRIDNTLLHKDVLKPVLALISSDPLFRGTEQELFSAFAHFRNRENKEAIVDALKALESAMKTILTKRKVTFQASDPASRLIKACFDAQLIPAYLQSHFTALRSVLESGVPTVRNKTSGHGQGATISSVDDHIVSFTLYSAAANIKLLIDCDRALP